MQLNRAEADGPTVRNAKLFCRHYTYRVAMSRGILDQVCAHMEEEKKIHNTESDGWSDWTI